MGKLLIGFALYLWMCASVAASTSESNKRLQQFNTYHKEVIQLEKAEKIIQQNPEKALELALDVLERSDSIEIIKAKANFVIGKCHLYKHEYDEALLCFSKAENVQRKIKDTLGLNNTLVLKGKTYYEQNEWNLALAEFMNTMSAINKKEDIVFIDLNELIGKTYFKKNYNDSGLYFYNRIIPELIKQKNHKKLGEVYHDLGYYYYRNFNYSKALDNYYKALNDCHISGNNKYLAKTYNKIGIINLKLDLLDEAVDSFEKGIEINKVLNDSNALTLGYNNLGLVYKHKSDVRLSNTYFIKGLEIAKKMKKDLNIALIHNNMGLLFNQERSYDSALFHFQISYDIYTKAALRNRKANVCNNKASTYVNKGDYVSAKVRALESLQLADNNQKAEVKKELYEILYEIYKKTGILDSAMFYLQKYKEIEDVIKNNINKNRSEDLGLSLFLKHKLQQYNELKKIHEESLDLIDNQELRIEKQRKYLFVLGVLFALLSFSIVHIVLLYFQKKKAHRQVSYRNKIIKKQHEEIAKQKQNLENTNYELEKMSIIAERTNNAVAITDKDGNFIWVNDGFSHMYGYNLNEFKQAIASNIFEASDVLNLQEKMQVIREKKIPVTYEFLASCKNNSKKWAQTTLTPLLNKKGEIYQYIAIDTDITELKSAEEKIKKQHQEIQVFSNKLLAANAELQKLSIIAEKTSNSVILIDNKGMIEWVNKSFTDIYGFTLLEIKGREYKQLVKEYFSFDIKKLVNVWFGTKVPVSFESLNNTKDKGKIWVNTSLTPIMDEHGELQKMVVVDSDITALKNAEQALKRINNDITASIYYAQRIQMASMPKENELKNYFNAHFIIFEPKDIVSGDFYWFTHHQNKTIVVAADCTGHGVPGAFMSLIGIASLNQIVKEKNITRTALILYHLRMAIIEALGQKGEIGEASDGMDVSIIAIDNEKNKVEISNAMTQLVIQKNDTIEILKGDRISIGYDQIDKGYSSQVLPLDKGDRIYMFSDGIIDQFGGEHDQKLKIRGFKEFLESIATDSFDKQADKIKAFLTSWQGVNAQLDDKLLIALEY